MNSVTPGFVDTKLLPPGFAEKVAPNLPMRRIIHPEEVSNPILFLLSDEASYIAGASLLISGAR